MKEKQDKRVAETVGNLARQERSSAELESKKVVLSKKKDVLNRAFETALADLENMPAKKKLAYYKAMVASAKDVIPEPKAVISVNDKFTAADLGVTAVEQSNKIRSGIILQSEDGKIEVDMQFSVLLKSVWDSNIKEITDILFESKEEAAAEAPAEEAESEVALG
jgi:V/A-type H+-transporting ATPase subunit E